MPPRTPVDQHHARSPGEHRGSRSPGPASAEVWRFSRELRSDRPSILHPPACGEVWALGGDRLALRDGPFLLVELEEELVAVRVGADPEVWSDGEAVVARGDAGGFLLGVGGAATVLGRDPAGLDLRLERHLPGRRAIPAAADAPSPPGLSTASSLTRVWSTVPPLPLPIGARRAADLRPWPRGLGVAWSDEGCVYVRDAAGGTRAVAHAARFRPGPHGALLLGDHASWTWGAAPGRPARPLSRPLPHGALRWADDGSAVTLASEDGSLAWIDLATGAVESRSSRGRPAGVDRWIDEAGHLVGPAGIGRRGLRAGSSARLGDRLAGPGASLWDLRTGRRVPVRPDDALAGAALAVAGEGFVSVSSPTGHGSWIRTDGSTHDPFRVPLGGGSVAELWVEDGELVLLTDRGRCYRVRGERVTRCPPAEPPDPPPSEPLPGGLPSWPEVEHHHHTGSHRWGWRDDGLLVAWPAPEGRGPADVTPP